MKTDFKLLVVLYLVLLTFSHSISAQTSRQTPLNNSDVLEMLIMGLSNEIIVAKIKASNCDFDTSPSTLEKLKAAGVPSVVMLAMIQATTSKLNKSSEANVDTNNREPRLEYGDSSELKNIKKIYIYTGTDIDARQNIINQITEKISSLKIVDQLDSAEAVLIYGSSSEVFLASIETNRSGYRNSTSTPIYRKVTSGSGQVLKIVGKNKFRLVVDFKDTRNNVFERRPSTNFAREFIRVYREANGKD